MTAAGKRELRVDQRKPWKGKAGVLLGTFELDSRCQVEVRNDGTTGHVVADAVQFVPAP